MKPSGNLVRLAENVTTAEFTVMLIMQTMAETFSEQQFYHVFYQLELDYPSISGSQQIRGQVGRLRSAPLRQMLSYLCIGQKLVMLNSTGPDRFRIVEAMKPFGRHFLLSRGYNARKLRLLRALVRRYEPLLRS